MNQKEKLKLTSNTAVIMIIIMMIVGVLLILNFWQLKTNDPLESKSYQSLVEYSYNDTGNDQLKKDIRNMDLLARKAYFTSKWQLRSGSYILLIASIILIVSLRV